VGEGDADLELSAHERRTKQQTADGADDQVIHVNDLF
jgi:hypothetical protein